MLADIDFDYLQLWGHYRMLVGLHGRIRGRITDPGLNVYHLTSLGLCRYRLGEYWQVECPQARPHYPGRRVDGQPHRGCTGCRSVVSGVADGADERADGGGNLPR